MEAFDRASNRDFEIDLKEREAKHGPADPNQR